MLVVISGISGAGKDSVSEKLLRHPAMKALKLSRIVTYTDRLPRSGELDGYDYFFVTPEKLDELHSNHLLVEDPITYGTSRKATGKEQLEAVLRGKNKLWRIDPSLTLKIAQDNYLNQIFDDQTANKLYKETFIFFLIADHNEIVERRKLRDKDSYNQSDYDKRDEQDRKVFESIKNTDINIIENHNDRIEFAVEKIVNRIMKY